MLQSLGLTYRLIYRLVYLMAGPRAGIIGAVVLAGLIVMNGGRATDAIPYAVLWGCACFMSRFVLAILPSPGAPASVIPREQAIPPSALAVSITPPAGPEVCPELSVMAERLPAELRRIVSTPPAEGAS